MYEHFYFILGELLGINKKLYEFKWCPIVLIRFLVFNNCDLNSTSHSPHFYLACTSLPLIHL